MVVVETANQESEESDCPVEDTDSQVETDLPEETDTEPLESGVPVDKDVEEPVGCGCSMGKASISQIVIFYVFLSLQRGRFFLNLQGFFLIITKSIRCTISGYIVRLVQVLMMLSLSRRAHSGQIFDGDFENLQSFYILYDDPRVSVPMPGLSYGLGWQVLSGGRPDSYYQIDHTFYYGDIIFTCAESDSYVVDMLSNGGIGRVEASFDIAQIVNQGYSSFSLHLSQGETNFYQTQDYELYGESWVNVHFSLDDVDFDIDARAGDSVSVGNIYPDFSRYASPIKFGFCFGNRVIGGGVVRHVLAVDNLNITVHPAHCEDLTNLCLCSGSPDISNIFPVQNSSLPLSETVSLSGMARSTDSGNPQVSVLVDGHAVPSLDASGRFFAPIQVHEGENRYQITTLDRCGETTEELILYGVPSAYGDITGFTDVTAQLEADFRRSTWSTTGDLLAVEVAAINRADVPISGPLWMAVGSDLLPSTTLLNAEGSAVGGLPYVSMLTGAQALGPGDRSDYVRLVFHVPEHKQVQFTPRWLMPASHAPQITSAPALIAVADVEWRYDLDATDAWGHALVYELVSGPLSMSIDVDTGLLLWTPTPSDVGTHTIRVRVDDGFGGQAEQSFDMAVRADDRNTPPLFTSIPPARAAIGAPYVYLPEVIDPDGDVLGFTLLDGPEEMTADPVSGLITWPDPAHGMVMVELQVEDGQGGAATQRWTLVGGELVVEDGGPYLLGTPPLEVRVGDLYLYQPAATDPDGDVLSWSLLEGPPQLAVDPRTGRVLWPATAGDLGDHAVAIVVADPAGNTAEQRWTVTVLSDAPNRSPVFVSLPSRSAVAGQAWNYPAQATDADGEVLTYTLQEAPPGMGEDPSSGLVTWSPVDPGEVRVALRATDPRGAWAEQGFRVDVRAANSPPVITSGDPSGALVGAAWSYNVDATDPDGDALTYRLIEGPEGSLISAYSGGLSWSPTAFDLGDHSLIVEVTDQFGAGAFGSWIVQVSEDVLDPSVEIALFGEVDRACTLTVVRVCVRGEDNAGISSSTLWADGVELALETDGCADLTREEPVAILLEAMVVDTSGRASAVERQAVQFVDCNAIADGDVPGNPPPSVELVSPDLGLTIQAPTPIVATITDDTPAVLLWSVEYSADGQDPWVEIGNGVGEVLAGEVALFDPTLLPNGEYTIRITANDGVSMRGIQWRWGVAGTYKVGNFSVSFTDVVAQAAGLPIVITRTYDSLDTSAGDFGAGWTMGLGGGLWDTPSEGTSGDPFIDMFTKESMPLDGRVTIQKIDGTRVGFTPSIQHVMFFTYAISWTPDPGVQDTLVAEGPTSSFEPIYPEISVVWLMGGKLANFVFPYNPDIYYLKTPEGVEYEYKENVGLISVTDVHGNRLVVEDGGVYHYLPDGQPSNVSVTFDRDELGRINQIHEADYDVNDGVEPAVHQYDYDESGDLISYTDPLGNVTTYAYGVAEHPHYLTEIRDPLGRPTVRNVFDDEGRVIAQCNALGDIVTLEGCERVDHDVVAGTSTAYDAGGYRQDFQWDAAGNLVQAQRWLEDGTALTESFTYDGEHRLLTRNQDGALWAWTWDDMGRRTSQVDPNGALWVWTYSGDCMDWAEQIDPLGNVSRVTFNEACQKVRETDPLGAVTTHHYDEHGRDLGWTTPMGDRWIQDYDRLGRMIARSDAVNHTWRWVYDGRGDVVEEHSPTGSVISYTYDNKHNIILESWNDIYNSEIIYSWNELGLLVRLADAQSEVVRTFDAMGRLLVEATTVVGGPGSWEISYEYDNRNLVVGVYDTFCGITYYSWDAARRMTSARQVGIYDTGSQILWDSYSAWDQPEHVQRFVSGSQSFTSEFTYARPDRKQSVQSATHVDPEGTVIDEVSYQYDFKGQITNFYDMFGMNYVYTDSVGRIIEIKRPNFSTIGDEWYVYDSNGSRTSSHRSANYLYARSDNSGSDELIADDSFRYTYDASGRLVSRCDRLSGSCDEFSWNHRDQLAGLVRRETNGNSATTWVIVRDPVGRVVMVDRDGELSWFVYDGSNPVLVLGQQGQVEKRRMYQRNVDSFVNETVGAQVTWSLTDPLGTMRGLVDTNGHLIRMSGSDVFGVGVLEEETFQARTMIFGTDYIDFRMRVYDPLAGVFLSRDIYFPRDYIFLSNNPLMYSDPFGTTSAMEYAVILSMFGCEAGVVVAGVSDPSGGLKRVGWGCLVGATAGAGLSTPGKPWLSVTLTILKALFDAAK
jgi:YD repeat-containing protein